MSTVHLCVHGHFYQPPRQNPFTGLIDREPDAAPYHDFNEKIWDECYRANAANGNFSRISFNVGPTLAAWLDEAHHETLRGILDAARINRNRTGHGNALAQAYHHTILPLATRREKRLQIAWGIRDFQRRYGSRPEGMWLPEAAADGETLEELAAQGMTFTILAPWQAATDDLDPTEPYRVALPAGRSLTVFFYNARLSGSVSFDDTATTNAGRFCADDLAAQINAAKQSAGRTQIILVATDGELYGHHKRFRDLFLSQLLDAEAPARGFAVTTLGAYLAAHPATAEVEIRSGTSWSCMHGVARWSDGCTCTEGDSSWKSPLRRALRRLATRIDAVYEAETASILYDPWHALEEYIDLRDGAVAPQTFWAAHARRPISHAEASRLRGLLEMEFARQAMFVSCAWFFDDVDRIEPRIALAYACQAVALAAEHAGACLAPDFLSDLVNSLSLRTSRTAAEMYQSYQLSALG